MSITLMAFEAAQSVQNLAGVGGGDGASGALYRIANKVLMAASVILAAGFVVMGLVQFFKGGSKGFKDAIALAGQYAFWQGAIVAVWGIARVAGWVFGGFAS